MVPYLRAANVKDGRLDFSDVKEMNFDPKEQVIFALRPGDVLVTEGSGSISAVGASSVWNGEIDGTVCFQNTLLRLRPRAGTDPRFLAWWCRHAFADGLFASAATGANIYHLSAERIRALPMNLVRLAEQRAIANYLDVETARIDALIAKKQQLIHLLEERAQSSLFDAVGDWRVGEGHTLRQHGTSVLTGPFGTVLSASEYISGGVPLVNPTHIKDGRIVPEEGVSVSEKVANRIARHRLSVGDLVMGRKGDVGRSAIVTSREEGWICGSDSIAIRCSRNLDPEFLAIALHVGIYRQQLAANSTGAMVLSVNEGTLLGLELPAMSPQEQRAAVLQSRVLLRRQERLRSLLDRHLNLLVEHRQALITAAVTGDFAVPGAA